MPQLFLVVRVFKYEIWEYMLYYPTKCDMSVSRPVQGIFLAVEPLSHKETALREVHASYWFWLPRECSHPIG